MCLIGRPQQSHSQRLQVYVEFLGVSASAPASVGILLVVLIVCFYVVPGTTHLHLIVIMQDEQQLLQLVRSTYQAQRTQEAADAHAALLQLLPPAPPAFQRLERLLTSPIEPDAQMAVGNLVRYLVDHLIASRTQSQAEREAAKRTLYGVEHIFDNQKVGTSCKRAVGDAYVRLYLFCSPENQTRLASKSRYYFNIREYQLALFLIQAYQAARTPYRYRPNYYELVLPLLVEELHRQLQEEQAELRAQPHLLALLRTLNGLVASLTFQKYEKIYCNVLGLPFFPAIVQLAGLAWPPPLLSELFTLLGWVTASLSRCQLVSVFPQVGAELRKLGERCLGSGLEGEFSVWELEVAVAAVEGSLIHCELGPDSLYLKMIKPLCKSVNAYLSHQGDDWQEMLSFLDDVSFSMESETHTVLLNRLLSTLCRASPLNAAALRALLALLFADPAPLTHPEGDAVECAMVAIALQVGVLQGDLDFLKGLETFLNLNYKLLLENDRLAFHCLIVYRNYMDDLFASDASLPLRAAILHLALTAHPLAAPALAILAQRLALRPPGCEVQLEVQSILEAAAREFKWGLLDLLKLILEHYAQDYDAELVARAVRLAVAEGATAGVASIGRLLPLVQLLLGLPHCCRLPELWEEVVEMGLREQRAGWEIGDELLGVLSKGVEMGLELGERGSVLLMRLEVDPEKKETFKMLKGLMVGLGKSDVVGEWMGVVVNWMGCWLSAQLTLHTSLLLHCLIHIHPTLLAAPTLSCILQAVLKFKPKGFDYVTGKVRLLALLVLRFCPAGGAEWAAVGGELAAAIYADESCFRWAYDMELFLTTQLWLFSHPLPACHRAYANVAFTAILNNLLRAQELGRLHDEPSDSDSDESLHPRTATEHNCRLEKAALAVLSPPAEWFSDYLSEFQLLVARLRAQENSRAWLEKILGLALRGDRLNAFQQLLVSRRTCAGLRKIARVRRPAADEDQ